MIENLIPTALVIATAVLALMILRYSETLVLGTVLVGLCFVPVWIAASIGSIYVTVGSGILILAICALVPVRGVNLTAADGLLLFLLLAAIASLFLGNFSVALSALVRFVLFSLVGYVAGRLLTARVGHLRMYEALSTVMVIVALLAILEGVSGFNPFVLITTGSNEGSIWTEIQTRGGINRVEGAFGHSIALGGCLAMTIPLMLATSWRTVTKIASLVVLLTAVALTVSRIGIITAVLGLILSIILLRGSFSRRARSAAAGALLLVAAIAVPFTSGIFVEAGTEASGSAAYRGDLTSLIERMRPIGVSSSAYRDSTGALYFGDFRSIDSQFILSGLQNGLLPLAAIVIALGLATAHLLRGRANAATIAVVAQIPAFATVALITQYSTVVWLIVGIAATRSVMGIAEGRPMLETRAGNSLMGTALERRASKGRIRL